MNISQRERAGFFALILCLGIEAALSGCRSQPVRPEMTPTAPHFRVATYNINWGMPAPRETLRAIEATRADTVCLQEVTAEWVRYLLPHLREGYPYHEFRLWRGAAGMAIFSKMPFRSVTDLPPRAGWFPAWLIRAQTPVGEVEILNLHLKPPLSERGSVTISAYLDAGRIHEAEVRDFCTRMDGTLPRLVLGDFNEGDYGDGVGWLRERGMTDSLREFDRYTDTWKWRVSVATLKKRLDHILYSEELTCLDARVVPLGGSDHYPVVALFTAAFSSP